MENLFLKVIKKIKKIRDLLIKLNYVNTVITKNI